MVLLVGAQRNDTERRLILDGQGRYVEENPAVNSFGSHCDFSPIRPKAQDLAYYMLRYDFSLQRSRCPGIVLRYYRWTWAGDGQKTRRRRPHIS
jgi:hypothetical protein